MSVVNIKDSHSASSASIAVDRGFSCFAFHADVAGRMVDVIDAQSGFESGEGRPSGNGIPILFPYPNRIRAGRFTWAGREYHLPAERVAYDNTGNAIHGFCLDRPWRIIDQSHNAVTGEFHLSKDAPDRRELWPADFIIRCHYSVHGPVLRSDFEIINPDNVTLPWGLGTHAYFKVPLSAESDPRKSLLIAPVTKQWPLEHCLPVGPPVDLASGNELPDGEYFGSRSFDDVFSGVPADIVECGVMDEQAGLQMTQRNPGSFAHLVIYTPPNRNAVCFEPYTCVTDAINLEASGIDAGWRSLGPGERFATWIEISAGPVLA